jgi:hypothetical protein
MSLATPVAAPSRPQRRWLTFSLRTFLVVTLLLSVILGFYGRAWLKAYRDSQPPTLYELAQIAKRHGIPMPPKEAKLVFAQSGERWWNGGGCVLFAPVFFLQDTGHGIEVLCGDETKDLSRPNRLVYARQSLTSLPLRMDFTFAQPDPAKDGYDIDWEDKDTLLCAVQLADRGDAVTAQALFEHWLKASLKQGTLASHAGGDQYDLRNLVREIAYRRLEQQLNRDNRTTWPEIRDRLRKLLEESEPLQREHGALLADLETTLRAPPPAPYSVEAQLVATLDSASPRHDHWRMIVERGFEAIPELIRLSDDRRITGKRIEFREPGTADDFQRLGDLANDALLEICVDRPDEGAASHSVLWTKWWNKVREEGERGYYVRNFFDVSRSECQAQSAAVAVLAKKYPDSLIHIGEEFRAATKNSAPRFRMVQAIKGLELPDKTKVAMIVDIAEHAVPLERRFILFELFPLDQQLTAGMLIQMFDEVSADLKGFEIDRSHDGFPNLILVLDQPRLTQAYLRAAKRNASLRMELLSRLAYWYLADSQRSKRLALLAEFLDDETPRDRSLKSEQFFSDDFPGITVRDFAAMHLAKALAIDAKPESAWTPEQWSSLRQQVRERLKEEELPTLE